MTDAVTRDALRETLGDHALTNALSETIAYDPKVLLSGDESVRITRSLPSLGLALPDTAPPAEQVDIEASTMLGQGGMGRVYAARQRTLSREVAVKCARADAPANADDALLVEALLMGHLEHPGIVPVHALGAAANGRPALVMKLIEGIDWRTLLTEPEHPMWTRLERGDEDPLVMHLRILQRVCDAVHFANERGVVHRDIKPANVMVGRWGEVWLLDWGVACTTAKGPSLPVAARGATARVVGTPAYMAPEMAACAAIDARTDVYLLGATLHEVLTGQPRHEGINVLAAVWRALQSAPFAYASDVPEDLAALCNEATHRDPAQRPQSALEFRKRIDAHLRHRGARALLASSDARLAEADALALRGVPETRRTVYEALAACRFGYDEAARAWPGNPRSLQGLRATRLAALRFELAVSDLEGARIAAAELDGLPEDLRDALDALATRRAHEDEVQRRLEALGRDHDPTLHAKARAKVFAALIAASVGMSLARNQITHEGLASEAVLMIATPAATLVAQAAIAWGARSVILANAYGRRLIAGLLVAGVTALVSHALVVLLAVPIYVAYVCDMVAWAAMAAALALTLNTWFGGIAALLLVGATVAAAWPAHARLVFLVVQVVVATLGAMRVREGR